MREYLFHGKCKETGEWVEGHYACESNHACFQCELKHRHYIFRDEFMDWGLGGLCQYEVIPESVGQCTEMKDKNGRKIFEGDIVRLDKDVKEMFNICDGVVKYDWGGFYIGGFSTLNSLNAISTFDGVVRGEVIGTVFENADLLEG